MNERILKALMTLFAIIAELDEDGKAPKVRAVVQAYLLQHLNIELTKQHLELFDKELERLHRRRQKRGAGRAQKQLAVNSVRVLIIAQQLNEELVQKEKIIVILRLFDFFIDEDEINSDSIAFLDTLAEVFNIPKSEYDQIKALCLSNVDSIRDSNDLLTISHFFQPDYRKSIHAHQLDGEIYIINLQSVDTYIFQYNGKDSLYLNGQPINNHVNMLENGSAIKCSKFSPIYYSDITSKFIAARHKHKVVLRAEEIQFKFPGSDNGIQPFSFQEESGNMIGVMGGSGVGKSTLLNVLNGNLPMLAGKITINGHDITSNREQLEGVIGFVPQDDLLIEELSVFQNLFFNAKLCFANFSEKELIRVVAKILVDLDLDAIKHLTVGDPLNKFISGGQRKRLNIALELMREPSVLIVDEPTSGLSSMDSEIVMNLLKEQAIKGKLVIVNIHQPSSDIFKMFDKLIVMDKGGHPVYYGNPVHAVVYFKKANHIANADESQCLSCGNVNPEQILEIVESKMVNEYGQLTRLRKRSPHDWYKMYQEEKDELPASSTKIDELPENHFKIPSLWKQFVVFLTRNILSKFTDKQYLLINFFEAPLLAIILGYFTKYIAGTETDPSAYIFSKNENLPAYLFMAVIVALFIGMTVSAEEIIRDRRILKRESFLNLSKFAYLNSKVIILFLISGIQMLTFVLLGNSILGIHGLTLEYWFLLFSTAALANLIGLNISSALNSVVNIYILIPFILVPQLLLSGVIVSFDKLHQSVNSARFVPFVGDLMTSRWAYEALAVKQFSDNKFERHFFWTKQRKSTTEYQYVFLIPEIENRIKKVIKTDSLPQRQELLKIVTAELRKFPEKTQGVPLFNKIDMLTPQHINQSTVNAALEYLNKLKKVYRKISRNLDYENDSILNNLTQQLGSKKAVVALKINNHNEMLASTLRNEKTILKIKEEDSQLIQTKDPIYQIPENQFGRSHFYAPVKNIFGWYISTYWFNTITIWLTTLTLYLMLLSSTLERVLNFSKKIRKLKFWNKKQNIPEIPV